jgi:hypothetical protein
MAKRVANLWSGFENERIEPLLERVRRSSQSHWTASNDGNSLGTWHWFLHLSGILEIVLKRA